MANVSKLPAKPVVSSAFEERTGRSDVFTIDTLAIRDGEELKLVFEGANSAWRQGVWLATDRHIVVADQKCPSVQLWRDTAQSSLDDAVALENHIHMSILTDDRRIQEQWAQALKERWDEILRTQYTERPEQIKVRDGGLDFILYLE